MNLFSEETSLSEESSDLDDESTQSTLAGAPSLLFLQLVGSDCWEERALSWRRARTEERRRDEPLLLL